MPWRQVLMVQTDIGKIESEKTRRGGTPKKGKSPDFTVVQKTSSSFKTRERERERERAMVEEKNGDLQIPACGKMSALLVVSMQNDFVLPSSPVRLETAAAIVPLIKQAISFARERGALVVWVVREHHLSGRDIELFRRHKFTGAVVRGTKGAAVLDELDPQQEDHVIVKTRFSAFFGTNLHLVLQAAGIQNLIFAGIQTPNCIRQAVFDAVAYDYPSVVVLSDATAAKKPEVHEANLYDMRMVKVATPTVAEWMGVKQKE